MTNKNIYECPCGSVAFNVLLSEELRCIVCGEVHSIEELRVFNASKQEKSNGTGVENKEDN